MMTRCSRSWGCMSAAACHQRTCQSLPAWTAHTMQVSAGDGLLAWRCITMDSRVELSGILADPRHCSQHHPQHARIKLPLHNTRHALYTHASTCCCVKPPYLLLLTALPGLQATPLPSPRVTLTTTLETSTTRLCWQTARHGARHAHQVCHGCHLAPLVIWGRGLGCCCWMGPQVPGFTSVLLQHAPG